MAAASSLPYHPEMERLSIPEGITFDDVLLVPQRSGFTPDQVAVSTQLTPRIRLELPLVSAPMDTVTESALAIALAQEGGIGIIHKNLDPATQAAEVARVKRSQNGIIADPVTLSPDDSVQRAIDLMASQLVSGFPVTADGSGHGEVAGILTRRDINFVESPMDRVGDVMTPRPRLVTAPSGVSLAEAESLLSRGRVTGSRDELEHVNEALKTLFAYSTTATEASTAAQLFERLAAAVEAARAGHAPDILVEELRAAYRTAGELQGIDVSESILDAAFSRFCVGK